MKNKQISQVHCTDSVKRFAGLAAYSQEQIEYFQSNKIYTIQIESTDICNQGCLYCYAGSTPQEKSKLNKNEIKKIIDIAVENEVRMIDWLGGDPLLKPDWLELMEYVLDKGLRNNIWTSGLPLADLAVANEAVRMSTKGFISIHLDSLNPKIYEKLHPGISQDYIDKIIAGVENLLKSGKEPDKIINCLTFTIFQQEQDIKETIDWFWKKYGIRTCLVLFKASGCGSSFAFLEPTIASISESYKFRNNINYYGSPYELGTQDVSKFYCGTMLCVTFDGDVTPCSVIREGVGNIRDESFQDILDRGKDRLIMTELHQTDKLPGYCRRCKNNSVCWGCRANAWYYSQDWMAVDPKCWHNPANYGGVL